MEALGCSVTQLQALEHTFTNMMAWICWQIKVNAQSMLNRHGQKDMYFMEKTVVEQ